MHVVVVAVFILERLPTVLQALDRRIAGEGVTLLDELYLQVANPAVKFGRARDLLVTCPVEPAVFFQVDSVVHVVVLRNRPCKPNAHGADAALSRVGCLAVCGSAGPSLLAFADSIVYRVGVGIGTRVDIRKLGPHRPDRLLVLRFRYCQSDGGRTR